MGGHPQAIIDRQLLEDADIVIGIFGTRIGTPTEDFVSGTVQEIKKHVAAGKTAKVYFSDVPIPPSELDPTQWASVQAFREECKSMGLYATFRNSQDFGREFGHHLSLELNQGRYRWLAPPEESGSEGEGLALAAGELRLLVAAVKDDGSIISSDSHDGYGMRVGDEEFCDGTPRSAAKCRASLQKLIDLGAVEELSESIYRVTERGYEIADQVEESKGSPKLSAFDEQRNNHARTLVESLSFMPRDFFRLLLLKGGSARVDAISPAVANPAGGIDYNSLTVPLIQNGLITRADDHTHGYSTFTANPTMTEALKHLLFPRNEGNQTPFFKGI
jgi:hypothetical protein